MANPIMECIQAGGQEVPKLLVRSTAPTATSRWGLGSRGGTVLIRHGGPSMVHLLPLWSFYANPGPRPAHLINVCSGTLRNVCTRPLFFLAYPFTSLLPRLLASLFITLLSYCFAFGSALLCHPCDLTYESISMMWCPLDSRPHACAPVSYLNRVLQTGLPKPTETLQRKRRRRRRRKRRSAIKQIC